MAPKYLIIFALIAVTLAVYWRAADCEFVNYDDPGYVTENSHVLTGLSRENVLWAFAASEMSNWHPITWLSHMLDCQIYGVDPKGHHFTNIFLHITNVVLLFVFLGCFTGSTWRSGFVAALFALHPLHVESVAWISERKDVLSTLFFLLTILAYSSYVKKSGPARYLLCLAAFILGLMTKPMLVTLPILLILIDYWPLKRISFESKKRIIILDKIPFLILSAVSSVITIYVQGKGGAISGLTGGSLNLRLENALVAFVEYLLKMVWPSKLVMLYPLTYHFTHFQILGAVLFISTVSLFVYRQAQQHPYLPVGWLWFVITLLPVIGIIQVGNQSMADRYTYVPLIGIFIIVAWGGSYLLGRMNCGRKTKIFLAFMILAALSIKTWQQVGIWNNSEDLFRHTLKYTINNYKIHNNLGQYLVVHKRYDEAIIEYKNALEADQKRYEDSLSYIENPSTSPFNKEIHKNLGLAYLESGKLKESIYEYREVLFLDPSDLKARYNLGFALLTHGEIDEAINQYSILLKQNNNYEDVHKLLGVVLTEQGRIGEAISHFEEILKYYPDAIDAHYDLGILFVSQGKIEEGTIHLSKALNKQTFDNDLKRQIHEILADVNSSKNDRNKRLRKYFI